MKEKSSCVVSGGSRERFEGRLEGEAKSGERGKGRKEGGTRGSPQSLKAGVPPFLRRKHGSTVSTPNHGAQQVAESESVSL